MKAPRATGASPRTLFASWLRYVKSSEVVASRADDGLVQLIDRPSRPPATAIEQRLTRALQDSGSVPSVQLVQAVAEGLYETELRRGAAVSDLGMFGSGLFTAEIVRELRLGDGILWKINR